MIEVHREEHQAVAEALASGDLTLHEQLLAKLRARYDEAVAFGITNNCEQTLKAAKRYQAISGY